MSNIVKNFSQLSTFLQPCTELGIVATMAHNPKQHEHTRTNPRTGEKIVVNAGHTPQVKVQTSLVHRQMLAIAAQRHLERNIDWGATGTLSSYETRKPVPRLT